MDKSYFIGILYISCLLSLFPNEVAAALECPEGEVLTQQTGQKIVGDDPDYSKTISDVENADECKALCDVQDASPVVGHQDCFSFNYFTDKSCEIFMKNIGDPGVGLQSDPNSIYFQCLPIPETTEAPTTTEETIQTTNASEEQTTIVTTMDPSTASTTETTLPSATPTTFLDFFKAHSVEAVLIGMGALIFLLFWVAIIAICCMSRSRESDYKA